MRLRQMLELPGRARGPAVLLHGAGDWLEARVAECGRGHVWEVLVAGERCPLCAGAQVAGRVAPDAPGSSSAPSQSTIARS